MSHPLPTLDWAGAKAASRLLGADSGQGAPQPAALGLLKEPFARLGLINDKSVLEAGGREAALGSEPLGWDLGGYEAEVELLLCPMSPSQASFDSSPSWPVAMVFVPALPGSPARIPSSQRKRDLSRTTASPDTLCWPRALNSPHLCHLPPCTPLAPAVPSPTAQLSLGLSEHVMSYLPSALTVPSAQKSLPQSLSSGTPGFTTWLRPCPFRHQTSCPLGSSSPTRWRPLQVARLAPLGSPSLYPA